MQSSSQETTRKSNDDEDTRTVVNAATDLQTKPLPPPRPPPPPEPPPQGPPVEVNHNGLLSRSAAAQRRDNADVDGTLQQCHDGDRAGDSNDASSTSVSVCASAREANLFVQQIESLHTILMMIISDNPLEDSKRFLDYIDELGSSFEDDDQEDRKSLVLDMSFLC